MAQASLQQASQARSAVTVPPAGSADAQRLSLQVHVDLVSAIVSELAGLRQRQVDVTEVRFTGTGHIAAASVVASSADFASNASGACRLVYVRGHFTGGAGSAALVVSLDHHTGAAYDAVLWTSAPVGTGGSPADLNLRVTEAEAAGPSPWTIQDGDKFAFAWTNPGGQTWSLAIGIARA